MKEQISVYSNAAFWLCAYFVEPVGLSIALVFLGAMSAMYHATKQRFWRRMDIKAIYLLFNLLIGSMLVSMGGNAFVWVWVLFITLGLWIAHPSSFKTIPAQFILMTLIAWQLGFSLWFVPVFIVALIANAPFLINHDRIKHLYVDILHGLWHLGAAFGFYLIINQL